MYKYFTVLSKYDNGKVNKIDYFKRIKSKTLVLKLKQAFSLELTKKKKKKVYKN